MADRYDAKASELHRQHGFSELHVASLARESVRDAMVDLARRMCPECSRAQIATQMECGTWWEHRCEGYETGCAASDVWNWLKSQ